MRGMRSKGIPAYRTVSHEGAALLARLPPLHLLVVARRVDHGPWCAYSFISEVVGFPLILFSVVLSNLYLLRCVEDAIRCLTKYMRDGPFLLIVYYSAALRVCLTLLHLESVRQELCWLTT